MILFLLGGLVLLIAGGEGMVRGAVSLARNLNVPPAVIGLTVLAYGTSAPELVVSLESAFDGHADMALGNVVGSNISNTLLILGSTAILFPLVLDRSLLKPDGWLLLLISGLLWIFAMNGTISNLEGGMFVLIAIAYTYYTFHKGKKDGYAEIEAEIEEEMGSALSQPKAILYTLGGLLVMVGGGKMLVNGGVMTAQYLGVSEGVIGLTIIAVGTSLPELATSIIAARKGQAEMAVANVMGSNLMNIFGIIGLTALVQPLSVSPVFLSQEIPLLFVCSLLFVFGIWRGIRLAKFAGILGSLTFIGYITLQYLP